MSIPLTPDVLAWIRTCGPLHVLVGRLPAAGYVPVALTNATGVSIDCEAWQEWAPEGRIITMKLIVPAFVGSPLLANPRPNRVRLPASTTTPSI